MTARLDNGAAWQKKSQPTSHEGAHLSFWQLLVFVRRWSADAHIREHNGQIVGGGRRRPRSCCQKLRCAAHGRGE